MQQAEHLVYTAFLQEVWQVPVQPAEQAWSAMFEHWALHVVLPAEVQARAAFAVLVYGMMSDFGGVRDGFELGRGKRDFGEGRGI